MTSISDPPRNAGTARVATETEDVSAQTDKILTTERNILPIQGTDQPTPTSKNNGIDSDAIKELLRDILEAVQDSSIAGPTAAKDNRSRFWGKYKRVAEEHDSEFLERYSGDMDIVLIFAGLFSAVSTSFIVAMEPSLLPDPSDTTNALLLQIAQTLGNATMPGYVPMAPVLPVFAGPARTDVWVQAIAYLSLASSLLAAFGAVLGKQWLGYYKSSRYGRGSLEQRGMQRQEKFQGLQTWHLDAILQSFPLLIQASLLLFGLALSGHMWSEQRTIAGIIIATTVFGVLFYLFTLFASLLSPACPFQSPLSTILRVLRSSFLRTVKQYGFYWKARAQLQNSRQLLDGTLSAAKTIMLSFVYMLSGPRSTAKDIEKGSSQSDDEGSIRSSSSDDAAKAMSLNLPDIPLKTGAAHSVLWLFETSTDPEVLLAASRMVPEVEWHPDLDTFAGLYQLDGMVERSVKSVAPDEYDNAITHCRSLLYTRLEREGNDPEWNIYYYYTNKFTKKDHFLYILESMFSTKAEQGERVPKFLTAASDRPQDILQVLHLLPYAKFEFAGVDEYLQSFQRSLILGVMSRILDGQTNLTPSTPGVSDCAMVIGRLLGCQFHLKDKRKLDKSEAIHNLLWAIHDKIADILHPHQQDTEKKMCMELEDHTTRLDENSAKLKEHIAIDCLPFILSLSPIDSFGASEFLWPAGYLCICKIYFDKSVEEKNQHVGTPDGIGRPLQYIGYLQASIRGAVRGLKSRCVDGSDSTDINWRSSVWNSEDYGRPVDGSSHYPVILDYLEYLCVTFPENSPDLQLQGALLVSIYSLAHLAKSPAGIRSYLDIITFCMGADKPDELRRAALRAICAKRDIFLSPVEHLTIGWDAVLATFSATLYDVIRQTPHDGKDHSEQNDHSRRTTSDTGDLDECVYPYLKLISTLVQVDTWHTMLIQDGHLKATISLVTPQLIQTCPLLSCLRASITLRLLKSPNNETSPHTLLDLEEHAWQGIVTEFRLALTSRDYLVELYEQQQLNHFKRLLPEILASLEQVTSANIVGSILRNIPDARVQIEQSLKKKGEYSRLVGWRLDEFREELERYQQSYQS